MKKCSACKEEKDISEFGKKGHTRSTCKRCTSLRYIDYVRKMRKQPLSHVWVKWRFRKKKQQATKRGVAFSIEFEEFRKLFKTFPVQCMYCKELTESPHVDRIDNNKGYISGNCSVACKHCNQLKGIFVVEDIKRLQNIIRIIKVHLKKREDTTMESR